MIDLHDLKRMKLSGRWLFTLAPALWCAPSPAPAQEPVFTFNPPPNVTYHHIQKVTRIKEYPGENPATEVTTVKSRIAIRRTTDGFRVTETPLSVSFTQNGKPAPKDPYVTLQKIPMTLDLDPTGKAVRVVGIEDLYKKTRAAIPPGQRQKFRVGMDRKEMERRILAAWDNDVVNLSGQSARPGSTWTLNGNYMTPIGEDTAGTQVYRVTGEAKCPAGECVRLQVTREPNAEALTLVLEDAMGKEINRPNRPALNINILDLHSTETEETVVNPETLEAFSAFTRADLNFNMEMGPEITLPFQVRTRTVSTFEREKPGKPSGMPVKPKPKPSKPRRR